MRGRKPKPTSLRLIEGRLGNRRSAEIETHVPSRIPTCPAHLNASAKNEWKRLAADLHERGLLNETDRAALAGYCQAYGRWVEAERELENAPLIVTLPSGYSQQNTWLTIANKQMEIMHKFLTEFGMSPVSRARVDAKNQPGSSKFAGLIGSGDG